MSRTLPASERPASTLTPTTVALAIFCCLLWAGAYVTAKTAIGTPDAPGFGPFRAAFFRFGLAGALLAAWGIWRDPASLRLQRLHWFLFGRLAILGMALTYTFNYTGLALSTGTAAALLMATEPIWIALLAVLFLRERLTSRRIVAILFGLTGTILVVLSTAGNGSGAKGVSLSTQAMLGNLLIVLSLLWEAGAVLTVKRLTGLGYGGRTIVTYEFLLGALLLAPFAAWEQLYSPTPLHPTPGAWAAFWYLVVGCTLIAYTLWFKLLETTDASELTVFIFLQPVVGTLIGVVWARDPFSRTTLFGALLVLAALLAVTMRTPTRRRQRER